MEYNTETIIKELLSYLNRADYIKAEDIPDIDLYMDQVTTFMEEHLGSTRRHFDDKIMTKTMINNYAKNDLIPPPEKKKYNKEHIMLLIFIYYLKNILSISDIDRLLKPLRDDYFGTAKNGVSIEKIYSAIFSESERMFPRLLKDIDTYARRSERFSEDFPQDSSYLDYLGMVCMLGADIYIKKQMMERLIDLMPNPKD